MKRTSLILTILMMTTQAFARDYHLSSPNGKLQITIALTDQITWSVQHENTPVLTPSPLSVTLGNGTVWGVAPRLKKATNHSVRQEVTPPLYKKKVIPEVYNELRLQFRGDFLLVFRAYDQGVAYRFADAGKSGLTVKNEEVRLNFPDDLHTLVP